MFGLNNAQLIGRLGADATISHLTNGGRVANVSIATDESLPRQVACFMMHLVASVRSFQGIW